MVDKINSASEMDLYMWSELAKKLLTIRH